MIIKMRKKFMEMQKKNSIKIIIEKKFIKSKKSRKKYNNKKSKKNIYKQNVYKKNRENVVKKHNKLLKKLSFC